MNALEEAIRQQKEYLEFLGREIDVETKILAKVKREQSGFIATLREKERELENKEKQINEFFQAVESAKGVLKEREVRCNEREEKLRKLHEELLKNEDLHNWLESKKLIFLDRTKEELNKLNEDSYD